MTWYERLMALPVMQRSIDRRIMMAAILVGGAIRLSQTVANRHFTNAEAGAVARAIANGRGFGDAFFPGQGPTAHLLPITPIIGAGAYSVFGGGVFGNLALGVWALCITILSFALAAFCLRLIGASLRTAICAFACLCLVPIHSFTESVRWQVWDGGLGTLFGLATLAIVLQGEQVGKPQHFVLAKAALPAIAFIINPIVGLTAAAISGLSTLRHHARDGIVRPLGLLGLALVAVLTPWVVRNELVMKHPIVLRDNLGLELALANNPAFVDAADPQKALQDRLEEIHPFGRPKPARVMIAAGGEYAYSQKLLASSIRWMKAHPDDVTTIWLRHFSEVFFPRPWMFVVEHEIFPTARSIVAIIISILGILSLLAAAIRREAIYIYAAVFIMIPAVLTLPFQPVPRYCWIIFPLMACLAVDIVARFMHMLQTRRLGPAFSTQGKS